MGVLPGQLRKLTDSREACSYCGVPATHELIGEVDGFGHESTPYCEKHGVMQKEEHTKSREVTTCAWCKTIGVETSPHRDFEEGSNGPLYDVCDGCRSREIADLNDETDWEAA